MKGSRPFQLVMNAITTKGMKESEAVCHFLAGSQAAKQDLPCFFQAIAGASDPALKQRIFTVLVNVISLLDFNSIGFDENSALETLKSLGDFDTVLPSIDGYFLLADAVRKLYGVFGAGLQASDAIQRTLLERRGRHSTLVLAILSERYDFLRQHCLDSVMKSFDISNCLNPLELAFALRYVTSEQVQSTALNVDKVAMLIQHWQSTADLLGKQSAIFFLATMLRYLPASESMPLFTRDLITWVLAMLEKDYGSRRVVFELADALPASDNNEMFNVKAQLASFLPFLAASVPREHEKELMPKLVSFVTKRRDSDVYPMTLELLPSKPASYRTCVLLAVETGDFRSSEKLLKVCFPVQFSEQFGISVVDMVPLVAAATPNVLTHENVGIVAQSLIAILCMRKIEMTKEFTFKVAEALKALAPFSSEVLEAFMAQAHRIATTSALLMLCTYFLNNIRAGGLPERDYSVDYCSCVAVLSRFIVSTSFSDTNKKIFLDFLSLVSQKFVANREEIRLTTAVRDLFVWLIPNDMVPEFSKKCLELVQIDATYALCCAALPNLNATTVVPLVESVNGRLKIDEFVAFYATRASVNSGEAIGHLIAFAKSVRGSGLSGLFKKSSPVAIQCIIRALTVLLNERNLLEPEVKSIMDITKKLLPKGNEEMAIFGSDAAALIEALAKRQEIRIPAKLVDEWLKVPAYIEALPYLLSHISPSDARVSASAKAWALHISGTPADSAKTKDITEALFKFRDKESTLDLIINPLTQCLESANEPLEIVRFAGEVASAAKRKMWKYQSNPMNLLAICAPYCLSTRQDLRVVATQLLMDLFVIPEGPEELKHFRLPLPAAEAKIVFLILFGIIFKQIPGRDCLPLFERCVTASPLRYHHVMTMRAMLAAHGDDFVEHQVGPLVKMCALRQGKADQLLLNQVEIALLSFASLKPTAFMRFLCATQMNELTTNVIVRLMMKEELRAPFINDYVDILVKGELMSVDLGAYSMLSAIVKADVNKELSGQLVICCLLWIGKIILEKANGPKQVKDLVKLLSSVMSTSTGVTAFNTTEEFVCLLDSFAHAATRFNEQQLDACIKTALTVIESGQDYIVSTVGIFFIMLFNFYASYTTPRSCTFVHRLSGIVGACFDRTSSKSVQNLAYVMRTRYSEEAYRRFAVTDQNKIFCGVIGALSKDPDSVRGQTIGFFCWLLPLTTVSTISSYSAAVIQTLQKSFTGGNKTPVLLRAVAFLIQNGIQPMGPSDKTKLSIPNLVVMSGCNADEVQQNVLDVLKATTRRESIDEIIQGVVSSMDSKERRALCEGLTTEINAATAEFSNMTLLKFVAKEMKPYAREVEPFFDSVGELCINILAMPGHPCTSLATAILNGC